MVWLLGVIAGLTRNLAAVLLQPWLRFVVARHAVPYRSRHRLCLKHAQD